MVQDVKLQYECYIKDDPMFENEPEWEEDVGINTFHSFRKSHPLTPSRLHPDDRGTPLRPRSGQIGPKWPQHGRIRNPGPPGGHKAQPTTHL